MTRAKTINYPADKLEELASALRVAPESAILRAARMRLTPVCGRCGGTGNYSFNQRDGTRCFGCAGAGHVVPKVGDLPGIIALAIEAVASGELDRYIERVEAAKVAKNGNAALLKAYGATATLRAWAGWVSHGTPDDKLPGNGPALRRATHAMHDELKVAQAAISAWQYPGKATTFAERQELAVAARVAVESAIAKFSELDVEPDAELLAFIHNEQRLYWERRKRGPWAHAAGDAPELFVASVEEA